MLAKKERRQQFFNEMVAKHGDSCMLCGRPGILVIDHDKAGLMRGLLCPAHNYGLGMFGDSPDLLEKAATYLRDFSKTVVKTDRRRTQKAEELKFLVVLSDNQTLSGRAKAREFVKRFPHISFAAAHARVRRTQHRSGGAVSHLVRQGEAGGLNC